MKRIPVILLSIISFLFFPVVTLAQQAPTPTIADAVLADLASRNYLNNVSVFMYDQKEATAISVNQDKQWIPASTVKLFVAMYAFDQITKKIINKNDLVTIDGKNVVPTEMETPELPALQEGQSVTILRLITQMITQSDNTAYNTLLDVLDRRNVTNYVHAIGLAHTEIGSKLNLDDVQSQYEELTPGFGINTTTAQDYANAYLLIENNKLPYAQELFTILTEQKINNMIPLFLPKDVVIAHKTGDWDPLYHDGGIIKLPKNEGEYILAIFSNLGDPSIVAHISQLVYTKDYSLVGQELATAQSIQLPPIDPTLLIPPSPALTPEPTTRVLGVETILQNITAADLGIQPADLSFGVSQSDLPNVYIPATSYFHSVVPLWYFVRKLIAFTPQAQARVDLDAINQQVAEANNLLEQNKKDLAYALLTNVQSQLSTIAKENAVKQDPSLQSKIEEVSQSRFQLLGNQLQKANKQERLAVISVMAAQAKQTLQTVIPNVPQAASTTDLTAHPLIGKVVQKTDTSMIVQTTGGENVTVPLNQAPVKVREQSQVQYQSTGTIQTGTTVAVVGTTQNAKFVPTFVLTRVPQELAAPQPVKVEKVNIKNNTIIVDDNGVKVQVDITGQTAIKANNTNIALSVLKPGDTVVVHGQPLPPTPPTVSVSPTAIVTGKVTITGLPSGIRNTLTQGLQITGKIIPTVFVTSMPEPVKQVPTVQAPASVTPHVIVGQTIQVVQTQQQTRSNPPAPAPKKEAPKQESHPSAPAPAAPAPKQEAPKKK